MTDEEDDLTNLAHDPHCCKVGVNSPIYCKCWCHLFTECFRKDASNARTERKKRSALLS